MNKWMNEWMNEWNNHWMNGWNILFRNEEFLGKNNFETALVNFSVVMTMVPRLLVSLEDFHGSKRVSQMLIVRYNLLNSQNIPINQYHWKMVGYKEISDIAKKAAAVAQKKEQWLAHVEFYPQWKWDNLHGA